jgi:hypothetical protein
MADMIEVARTYRDNHHWVPLRLVGKKPKGDEWQKRTLQDPVPEFKTGDNIGVLLGAPSGDMVRLDADFPVIPTVAARLFPVSMTFGRSSSPRSGRLLICKGLKSTDFKLPDSMKDDARLPLHDDKPGLVVFQILSTGKQTVVPPSVHLASGEQVVWEIEAPLAELDAKVLLGRVGVEAFCMAVRQFWPARGTRNEAAMAMARVLLEALDGTGTDEQRIALVDDLVEAVAMAGGDGEASRDGKRRAVATLAKMNAGEETTGMTRLLELLELPEGVAKLFRKWLGITKTWGAPDWRERRTNGAPLASFHNAILAINALGVTCSFDTFHNKLLFGDTGEKEKHAVEFMLGEVNDNGIIALRQLLSDRFGFDLGEKHVRDAVISLGNQNHFNPIADLLAEAEANWDGVERLDRMAVDYFNCADTPFNRAAVRKWMIAGVARVRNPGCKFDNMLVLESVEGYFKSTAFLVLACGEENFSDESIIGRNSREVQEQLASVWIHENAELTGMTKADAIVVKAFASRTTDRARPAYGHFQKEQKRHSVEAGTTNSSEYLASQDGNRRIWPMCVLKSIDIGKLQRDVLLLWGEAAHYQSKRESLTIDESLWNAAGVEQEARRVKDPWENILADIPVTVEIKEWNDDLKAFSVTEHEIVHHIDNQERVASHDLLTYVLETKIERQTPYHGQRVATVMKLLGWQRASNGNVTIAGKQVKGYFRWVKSVADDD